MPALNYELWKASVAATEWGHYVAVAALLLLLVPGWIRSARGRLSGALAVTAIIIALSPSARALRIGSDLGPRLHSAFGNVAPRARPGAPSRARAFTLAAYLRKPASPGVIVKTVTYVTRDGRPLELDIYRRSPVSTNTAAPMVITIHGGSWVGGSRSDLSELNYYLASRGYVVAAISYRFAPEYPFPAATEDVNTAVDYLIKHARALDTDSTRVALVGRSAGGQLALQTAYTKSDPSIKGVVALYAPTDQEWGWEHPANPRVYDSFSTLRSFLNGEPSDVPDAYRQSSPINFVRVNTVPTLLIHGGMDPLVSVKQSQRLDSALTANQRPHVLIVLPWATHGCDYAFNGPCGQIATFSIERFLASVLR